ncbi:MAG: hypothetical protein J6M30_08750 [Bacteroidales bacterium]|nr:hypothetical protein [Bacteroidales bacterium]
MNDSVNILSQKSDELIRAFLSCICKNTNDQNKELADKIDLLTENCKRIIEQNEEIIRQNNLLLSRNTQMQSEAVAAEVQPVQQASEKKEEIITQKEPEEEIKPVQTVQQEESVQVKEQQEAQKKSSVLEFLHQRVIKDKPETTQQETQTPVSSAQIITEKIKKEPASIAERFENKNKQDLLTAIGVSEKFMFINDLFQGNVEDYNSFITEINSALNFEQSMQTVAAMQSKRKWAKGSLAYTTLESLIAKRFE